VVYNDRRIEDGDRVDAPGWQTAAIWTRGDSPGHLCSDDEARELLRFGDHVLPQTTG
jgi:hypothetical protein